MPGLRFNYPSFQEKFNFRYRGEKASAGKITAPRMYMSSSDPGVNDDDRDSGGIGMTFAEGDLALNDTDFALFICADPSDSAADWRLIGPGIGSKGADETDLAQGSFPWYDTTSGKFEYGVRWDDMNSAVTSVKLGGINDPSFVKIADDGAGSTGVYAYKFNEAAEKEVFIYFQYLHSRKLNSDFDIHVHWQPTSTDTGAVVWGAEYITTDIGDTIPVSILSVVAADADGTDGKHQLASIVDITGAALSGLSGITGVRLYRNATAAADTYDTGAVLLYIDSHYQQDSVGSTEELVK
jgi:hypothetical protein